MSRRVLVADDSLMMRRMVSDTLVSDGWEIAGEAANGQEAAELYDKVRPDVVTLDIVMPGVDGMEALRRILHSDPNAKVIVVSALSQTKLISEAIRLGAQDFVAKPFLPEQLHHTMRACLESSGRA
jgi:two-component system chemotaxis response regulator CheY